MSEIFESLCEQYTIKYRIQPTFWEFFGRFYLEFTGGIMYDIMIEPAKSDLAGNERKPEKTEEIAWRLARSRSPA